jgi:enoyl-CoA hydratase/carnithine racemase
VKTSRHGALLRLTLDRPEQHNRLSTEDCARIAAAANDAASGVLLIESTGAIFCGGLAEGCDPGRLFDAGTWHGIPVVVAVQGPALDEGVALLACAHVVIAAQGASFAITSIRRGAFPALTFPPLARAIGHRRALELALTGRVFTAADALAFGLLHQTAPAFEFDDRAEAIAASLADQRLRANW